jgi:menaquinone-dependent protoporphyrinogen oxidase
MLVMRKLHKITIASRKEVIMADVILIAYASQHGSTLEVAEAITATLREHGLQVELRPASEVRALDDYCAVVLGAPLYVGRWHKDAHRFLGRHHTALLNRPVAIFALGPLGTTEEEWHSAHTQLNRALAKSSWLTPVAVELFGGVIDPAKLHFPFNRMKAGDARNWTAIRAFADRLAIMFQPAAVK